MMMRLNVIGKFVLIALALTALLCVPCASSVMAQCAMCKAAITSGSGGAAFAKSFNTAILVLLAPPVTIFCSIFVVAYRHRKSQKDRTAEEEFDGEQQQ
jgi:heme/copper-type cytochrome/quinol oxidase subunit 2